MKILVTYAVQGELIDIKWADDEFYYMRTGIGKTKSAFRTLDAILQLQPDLVINVGTAGTVKHRVGEVFACRRFIDRDMQKLSELGVEWQLDTTELLESRGFCRHWTETGVCNTGDSFLTDNEEVEGDVVDMEGFAQAFVCLDRNVPFIAVKYVTDVIGRNSVKHWEDKLSDAREALAHYFNGLKKKV